MNKWCASCFSPAEENVTLVNYVTKEEKEGFLLSDFKNHDNETDEEVSRTTQV